MQTLLRRFSRNFKKPGFFLQARKIRFYYPKKNRQRLREEAQRRAAFQTERERLIKLGEISEFAAYPSSRSRVQRHSR
jgi:ribosomal protein S21